MLPGNKVIITVAANGGMQQDRDGAVVPKQPAEIGEAAARCYEAGASMIHVHARDMNGKNTGDRKIYGEIIRQIRARSPILIQTTNGIGVRRDPATGQFIWPTDKERLGLLDLEPRQDLFGIAAGSADFYNPEGGYPEETPYVNSPSLLKQTIKAVYAMGSALEYEVVEASSLHRLLRYAGEGLSTAIAITCGCCTAEGSARRRRRAQRALRDRRRSSPVPEGDLGRDSDRTDRCSRSSRLGCRSAAISCASGSRTAYTYRTAASRVTTARWFEQRRGSRPSDGLSPATVDEARARFRI